MPLTANYSQLVSDNYAARVNDSYAPLVEHLLKKTGLQVLVISGLNDAKDCNFLGTGAWLGEAARQGRQSRSTRPDTTPGATRRTAPSASSRAAASCAGSRC